MDRNRVAVWGGVAIVSLLAGFIISYWGVIPLPEVDVRWSGAIEGYQPANERVLGEQLVMVFVGHSGCAGSNRTWLPASVKELKQQLQAHAQKNEMSFASMGVSLDWSVKKGVQFLRKFGTFDEIMVGGNWGNTGALRYIWNRFPGEAVTPQVVVTRRTLDVEAGEPFRVSQATGDTLRSGTYTRAGETLVVRKIGPGAIRRWVANGAALSLSD